jgi:hypothetical protein
MKVLLRDVFEIHRGARAPHLLDWRLKGPVYAYAVPRGPMYSTDGKHWEKCDVDENRDPGAR